MAPRSERQTRSIRDHGLTSLGSSFRVLSPFSSRGAHRRVAPLVSEIVRFPLTRRARRFLLAVSRRRSGRRQEPAGQRRQRRHLVGLERAHQTRRNQHHQLGAFRSVGLALEQVADDRELAEERDGRGVFLRQVVEQPGDGERLAIAQLDVGLGASRRERGNPEALQRDAVGEVERADFRRDLQPDDVAGDGRREVSWMPNSLYWTLTALLRPRPGRSGPGSRRRRGSWLPGRCRRSGSVRPGSGRSPSTAAPTTAPKPSWC